MTYYTFAITDEKKKEQRHWDLSQHKFDGELELDNFPNLITLNLGDNQLTGLRIGNCPRLRTLIVSHNKLACLEIENCPRLEQIFASNNCFTKKPNLAHLTNLQTFSCDLAEQARELNTSTEVPPKGSSSK